MARIRLFMVFVLLAGCGASVPEVSNDRAAALERARARQIARLHEYRIAGVFPIDDRGRPISVFRDAEGRPCPMARLIERSGRTDLVDQVAREDNTIRLADVHDGPLMAWMDSSGLTQEEVALVQGVMEIDYAIFDEQLKDDERVVAEARAEVARRLEHAERTLRARSLRR